jgi:hypothetical protein
MNRWLSQEGWAAKLIRMGGYIIQEPWVSNFKRDGWLSEEELMAKSRGVGGLAREWMAKSRGIVGLVKRDGSPIVKRDGWPKIQPQRRKRLIFSKAVNYGPTIL